MPTERTEQMRAVQTRGRIITSAAGEFAAHGYNGTSLSRVCATAEVTMGALTFHFPTKVSLAQAVCSCGVRRAREAVALEDGRSDGPLGSVGRVVLALSVLLSEEDTVRATARLAAEQPSLQVDWCDGWLSLVRARLSQAQAREELRPGVDPNTASVLVTSLIAAVQTGLLSAHGVRGEGVVLPVAEQVAALWTSLLRGIGSPTG
ncbi:TetR family transcriptional regulator [Streptomyces sp. SID1328]|uniref:TetR/AcrR family transcriptional regulator n=1 Tax=Streptomyces sp. SID1328 TaxID=2690250 RepID=UPI00136E890F|nr:TetR/AcrR family transcriptional regulator [Streptomyces sp. SID1328]MYV40976.1 TetR family transcriptional regulator [Streptomyces sp. SID1328]